MANWFIAKRSRYMLLARTIIVLLMRCMESINSIDGLKCVESARDGMLLDWNVV